MNVDSVATAETTGTDNAPLSEKFIIIKGKDIWVRDEPSIGKVVMKLNTGFATNLMTMELDNEICATKW